MTILAFLSLNGKWININPIDLYKLARQVSESNPKNRNKILKIIIKTITENLVDFPKI